MAINQEFRRIVKKLSEFEIDKLNINISFKEVQKLYFEIFREHLSQVKRIVFKKGTKLFRVRKNISNKLFTQVDDLSYPPSEKTPFGRVNLIGNPVYYCSDNSSTSILESKPERGDYITLVEAILIEDIVLAVIGHCNRYNTKASLDENLKEFYNLTTEFTTIAVTDPFEYLKSATLANTILSDKKYSGVIYPSIFSKYLSDNLALTTEKLWTNLKVEKITQFKVLRKYSESHLVLQCTACSNIDFPNPNLNWVNINDCPTHNIEFDELSTINDPK